MELNQKSTGLEALDDVIQNLRMGDNVVFQVKDIQVYRRFVSAFIRKNSSPLVKTVYIRFAQHPHLLDSTDHVEIFKVDADKGFEEFCTQIHEKVTLEGRDVFYIFDCLSELLDHWATDSMIGNFFKVTCPSLNELNTIAYFATYKNCNSFYTTAVIRDTTQVLIDIYEIQGTTYIHPLKVSNRYTPTLFLPHVYDGSKFIPVTSSGEIAYLNSQFAEFDENPERDLDYWDRLFIKARELLNSHDLNPAREKEEVRQLAHIFLTRDERILELISKYFGLHDILSIKPRLIGSGFIGGKAVGMLLSRKILDSDSKAWGEFLEPHDSFYIGSNVFNSYLIDNNLWRLKLEQRRARDNRMEVAEKLRSKIRAGQFNETIRNKFLRMLGYFGQSPIIVRSSSLLEDGFANAFPGKYESVFCINQGTLDERYNHFTEAVRLVYASTLSMEALAYREKNNLADAAEQMALLIQRVSGSSKNNYFFPDLAGVGFSYNTYVWDCRMNPHAGMIRLVLGLGTRAVNRLEGDYARIVALDLPHCVPYDGLQSYKTFSQRNIDILDISQNKLQSLTIQQLIDQGIDIHQKAIAERDYDAENMMKQLGLGNKESWVFSFKPLFNNTDLSPTLSRLLKTLETSYKYPVDIEFTINFRKSGGYFLNLLQCRPLQVRFFKQNKEKSIIEIPRERVVFKNKGGFMGGNIDKSIDKIIIIDPQAYSLLTQFEKYEVARTIGKINNNIDKINSTTLLLGPGRWGSRLPALGVPVSFAEINQVSVLGEIGYHQTKFLPDVSFGTHFFQNLVERDIFYLALYPEKPDTIYQLDLLDNLAQRNISFIANKPNLIKTITVYDIIQNDFSLRLTSDINEQTVQFFIESTT